MKRFLAIAAYRRLEHLHSRRFYPLSRSPLCLILARQHLALSHWIQCAVQCESTANQQRWIHGGSTTNARRTLPGKSTHLCSNLNSARPNEEKAACRSPGKLYARGGGQGRHIRQWFTCEHHLRCDGQKRLCGPFGQRSLGALQRRTIAICPRGYMAVCPSLRGAHTLYLSPNKSESGIIVTTFTLLPFPLALRNEEATAP